MTTGRQGQSLCGHRETGKNLHGHAHIALTMFDGTACQHQLSLLFTRPLFPSHTLP